jgi:hypothetical protein
MLLQVGYSRTSEGEGVTAMECFIMLLAYTDSSTLNLILTRFLHIITSTQMLLQVGCSDIGEGEREPQPWNASSRYLHTHTVQHSRATTLDMNSIFTHNYINTDASPSMVQRYRGRRERATAMECFIMLLTYTYNQIMASTLDIYTQMLQRRCSSK